MISLDVKLELLGDLVIVIVGLGFSANLSTRESAQFERTGCCLESDVYCDVHANVNVITN